MWLAVKFAAGAKTPPSDSHLVIQLGSQQAAKNYRRLFRDYPEVERGPAQSISDHYKALREEFARENAESGESSDLPSRLPVPKPDNSSGAKNRTWVRSPEEIEAEQASERHTPSDLNGMPQRVPGQFTGTGLFGAKPIPGYELPNPLPSRDPGLTLRPYRIPPSLPSNEEWVRSLADKGIYLNPDGTRMAEPAPSVARGHDIWSDLIRPDSQPPTGSPSPRGHDIWSDLISRAAASWEGAS